jgi:hypothetical protein
MGGWYWIGVSVGLGTAAGVLLAGVLTGLFGAARWALLVAAALAGAAGAAIGYGINSLEPGGWANLIGGVVGAVAGTLGAAQIVGGALRRGGTRGGTATLVAAAALAVAAVALVPALGYVEALAAPILALRLRGRGGGRYAGLRILARD